MDEVFTKPDYGVCQRLLIKGQRKGQECGRKLQKDQTVCSKCSSCVSVKHAIESLSGVPPPPKRESPNSQKVSLPPMESGVKPEPPPEWQPPPEADILSAASYSDDELIIQDSPVPQEQQQEK